MVPDLFQNTPEGRQAFEQLAHKIIHWLVDYYSRIESFPVKSTASPGEIYRQFDSHPPAQPVTDEVVFKVIEEVISR
jgi:aromatic-L-amino-acid decarboxylase